MTNSNPLARYGARWLARLQAVQGIISMGMLVLTGISTGVMALQQYGHGRYAWPLIGLVTAGSLAFTYAYAEFGVYNQQRRDHADFGQNYADPRMRIDDEMIGAAVFAAVHSREPTDEELETMSRAVDKPFRKYRDGYTLEND